MRDEFDTYTTGLTSPAEAAVAITASDTEDLVAPTRAIYVGGGGNLYVQMISGETALFENLLPGGVYALRIARVFATGTTATGLICLR